MYFLFGFISLLSESKFTERERERERERDIGVPTFEISESKALALQIHLGWVDMTTSPWTLVPVFHFSVYHVFTEWKVKVLRERERERERVVPRIQWHRRRKLSKSFTSLCAYGMLKVIIFAKRTQMVLQPSFLFHISNKSITTTTTATHPFNKPTVINDHQKK